MFSLSQDSEVERPLKRYGSSSSSEEYSSVSSHCSLSSQLPASCSSLSSSSSEDEEEVTFIKRDDSISKDALVEKLGESSSAIVNARDSQPSYSSSSKNHLNSLKSKSVSAVQDDASSPIESVPTNKSSEACDEDLFQSDFDVFSPLESRKPSNEEALLISKGEKTPHTLKKRPSNSVFYK